MLNVKSAVATLGMLLGISALAVEDITPRIMGLVPGAKNYQQDKAAIEKVIGEEPGQALLLLAESVLRLQRIDPSETEHDEQTFKVYIGSLLLIRLCGESGRPLFGPTIAGCLAISRDPMTKHGCCYALGMLQYKPASAIIAEALKDADAGARANAAWALGKMGRGEVLLKHINLLEDTEEDRVVWEVYKGLQQHLRFSMPPGLDPSQEFEDIRDFHLVKQAAKDLRKRLEEEARVREQK